MENNSSAFQNPMEALMAGLMIRQMGTFCIELAETYTLLIATTYAESIAANDPELFDAIDGKTESGDFASISLSMSITVDNFQNKSNKTRADYDNYFFDLFRFADLTVVKIINGFTNANIYRPFVVEVDGENVGISPTIDEFVQFHHDIKEMAAQYGRLG